MQPPSNDQGDSSKAQSPKLCCCEHPRPSLITPRWQACWWRSMPNLWPSARPRHGTWRTRTPCLWSSRAPPGGPLSRPCLAAPPPLLSAPLPPAIACPTPPACLLRPAHPPPPASRHATHRLGLARVSVVRGEGPMAGLPCIDDYVRATEPVFDYLTRFRCPAAAAAGVAAAITAAAAARAAAARAAAARAAAAIAAAARAAAARAAAAIAAATAA